MKRTLKTLFMGLALAGILTAFARFLPTDYWNLRLAEAASQIYPKDSTSFITVPFILRGAQVKDKDLTAPPASPSEGDRYIVASVATDTWAGYDGQIAEWHARASGTAQWYFYDPHAGMTAYVADEALTYVFDGSAWTLLIGAAATDTELTAAKAELRAEMATDTELAALGVAVRAEMATDTELAAEAAQLRAEAATDTELSDGLATKAATVHTHLLGDITDYDTPTAGLLPSGTQGDILYYDTDQWKVLAAGDAGKYLKTGGAAANPSWDTPAGVGDMTKAVYDLDDDGMVDTAEDLALASQAAGDIAYFDGTNWVRLAKDAGKYLKSGDSAVSWDDTIRTGSFGITVDGGGAEITTGSKGFVVIPYACTPKSWTILADQSGSVNISVKKATYADFPSMSDIVGTETPLVSTAQKNQDTSLTSWTAIDAGDTIEFSVNSCTTITRFTLVIKVER